MEGDFELLDRWQQGDKAAGQALLSRHFDSVCRFFESKVAADAEDLVQRTWTDLVASKDRLRRQASFRTYLFTLARHVLYHHLRARSREGERLDFSVTSIAELVSTPASRMIKEAERRRVVEALQQLPLEAQTLLELHYWEELDVAALSEVLELEPGATRVRLHRARKKLRELLDLSEVEENEALRGARRPG